MRPFTLRADVTTRDKSTKQVDKITKHYMKMSNTITKQSKIAGSAYKRFANNISARSKKALVSMNTLNASINRTFRNMSKKLGSLGLFVGFTAVIAAIGKSIGIFADFEQANAGLAAVMGKTVGENAKLIADSKRLGAITAKTSTEIVGLQESFARLGFVEKDILNMTESTVSGSIAMQGELAETAELVGAMVKSFDKFGSIHTPDIIDKLTLATQKSALNFEKLQTGLPIVAGAANAADVKFTRLLSSMGILSDAGIDASSSSTALRNIFLEAAKRGVPYQKLLDKVSNSTDKLKTANELFGKRGAVAAVILAKNTEKVNELNIALNKTNNDALNAANKQLDTLKGRLTLLGSAYEGFILSLDDGTGAMSGFLKKTIEVITEILALGSGTAKAKDQLNESELSIRKMANTGIFLLKTIKWITIAYIAFKAVMIATKIITTAYNIIVGIQAALFGTLTRSIVANKIALGAYTIVTKIASAATALFSAALWANPMTWVVVGIVALVAAIGTLIFKWKEIITWVKESDNWFAKILRASIYPLIVAFKVIKWAIKGVIQVFKDMIKWVATSDSGFAKFIRGSLSGLKFAFQAIGKALKWVGMQFSKLWDWIKKISGKALQPIKDVINFFSKETQKELGVTAKKELEISEKASPINKKLLNVLDKIKGKSSDELSKDSEILLKTDTNKSMIDALADNTKELNNNTDAAKGQWTGRFTTSILKDANITERQTSIVQKELATTSINNENNIVNKQKEVLKETISKDVELVSTNNINELKRSNIIAEQKEITKETEIVSKNIESVSVNKSTEELRKSTNVVKNELTGRFTPIVKDADIAEKQASIVQRELATTSINNENNITNEQKEIITPVTRNRKSSNVNGTINIIVENRTGGNFTVDAEGTGINVTTTGND